MEGRFFPGGHTSGGGREEVAGRGSRGEWSLSEGVEMGGEGEVGIVGEDVGEVSRMIGRTGGVMLWVGSGGSAGDLSEEESRPQSRGEERGPSPIG